MDMSLSLTPGEFHGQRNLEGYSPWVAKILTRLRNYTFFQGDNLSHPPVKDCKEVRLTLTCLRLAILEDICKDGIVFLLCFLTSPISDP